MAETLVARLTAGRARVRRRSALARHRQSPVRGRFEPAATVLLLPASFSARSAVILSLFDCILVLVPRLQLPFAVVLGLRASFLEDTAVI